MKGIGIRKVLGASVLNISALLTREFLGLILLSVLIAAPLAWWSMSKWLEGCINRIEIELWMFALAAAIAVLIALLTIAFHTVRAAVVNPMNI